MNDDKKIPKAFQGEIEPNYYCRGWNAKREKYCGNRAGLGTNHLGEGRCKFHFGNNPVKHGRYAEVKSNRVRDLTAEFRAESDPLNCLEELFLLRALVVDYIERYEDYTDALLAWHNSFTNEYELETKQFLDDYQDWRQDMTDVLEANGGWIDTEVEDLPERPEIPDPLNMNQKPRQVMDIISVGKHITAITQIVERIEKIANDKLISIVLVNNYLTRLGAGTDKVLRKKLDNDSYTAIRAAIEAEWDGLSLEPSTGRTEERLPN